MLARAIPHILEGMRQEYVNRLIVLGAAGVHQDYGKYQNALTTMALWMAKKTALKHPFIDQAAQERLIAASDVDYTIVRAPRLMDGPFTGNYRVLPDALPPGALRINRADVADFMLQQLTDPRFHRQGPYIGSKKRRRPSTLSVPSASSARFLRLGGRRMMNGHGHEQCRHHAKNPKRILIAQHRRLPQQLLVGVPGGCGLGLRGRLPAAIKAFLVWARKFSYAKLPGISLLPVKTGGSAGCA